MSLPPGLYALSVTGGIRRKRMGVGLALPAVHICAAEMAHTRPIEITDESGKAEEWLDDDRGTLFVKALAGGGTALVTAYLPRDSEEARLELSIRRLDAPAAAGSAMAAADLPVLTLPLGEATTAGRSREFGIDIIAHIRGRGDVYFFDAPWAGRLTAGAWIEAFTILPRDATVAAAIEYKGLTANGVETSWLGCGSRCGTTGQNTPLLGFAVRQKAGIAGARLNCEYLGYFQSGITAGPTRNGAPCFSSAPDDPLEGIQLRIIERVSRAGEVTAEPAR